MDNKEIIKGQVMTDEEFERALKIGINMAIDMAIDILRRHARDDRYREMNGTQAMEEIAIVLSTCNIEVMPEILTTPPQGTA